MDNNEVFLNASEHLFNLSFAETLMLRNYSKINNLRFCTMAGGSESIRDIQEAKNLQADGLEFNMVESLFALDKIFNSIIKIFSNRNAIENLKIFINVASPDGIKLITNIKDLILPANFKRSNIIFNFDRRSLIKTFYDIKNDNFQSIEYEKHINPCVYESIEILKANGFESSLSGGINRASLENILNSSTSINYLKTGFFTIKLKKHNLIDLFQDIYFYQKSEAKLLKLMSDSLNFRFNYINQRHIHLMNYLAKVNNQ